MDATEFKKLVLPLNGKLFHFACLLLKDKIEAEDALQEVYLKLWKIRETLTQYASIEAFAMKVTRNWCLDRLKAKKPVYIQGYQSWSDKRTDDPDPYHQIENSDKLNTLHALLQLLPEQQRLILQLREMEGLEFEKIAEIMDMQINAVRVNLSRARNRIKEEMIKYESNGNQSNTTIAGKIL